MLGYALVTRLFTSSHNTLAYTAKLRSICFSSQLSVQSSLYRLENYQLTVLYLFIFVIYRRSYVVKISTVLVHLTYCWALLVFSNCLKSRSHSVLYS